MSEKLKAAYRKLKYNFTLALTGKKTDKSQAKAEKSTLRKSLNIIVVLLIIFNVLFMAFRNLNAQSKDSELPEQEYERLSEKLKAEQDKNKQLEKDNQELYDKFLQKRDEMFALWNEAAPETRELEAKYNFASEMAGMKPYNGQGIRVTLADKESIAYDSTTSATEIVHDGDIRYIVEFFKSNYVEAIAVNGERISPMSKLLCTGPSVLVNRVYHSSPFIIEAGLKPEQSADSLLNKFYEDQIIQAMWSRGLSLKVEPVDTLELKPLQDNTYVNAQIEALKGGKK